MPNPSLISHLEEATEGSRELDAEIMAVCFDWAQIGPPYLAPQCIGDEPIYWHAPEPYRKREVPHVSTSQDAAVELITARFPGWWWEVDASGNATLFKAPRYVVEHAATPALALCLAALKAMEAKDGR